MGSRLKRALGQTHSWGLPESHLIIGSLIVPKGGKIMGEMADFFFLNQPQSFPSLCLGFWRVPSHSGSELVHVICLGQ